MQWLGTYWTRLENYTKTTVWPNKIGSPKIGSESSFTLRCCSITALLFFCEVIFGSPRLDLAFKRYCVHVCCGCSDTCEKVHNFSDSFFFVDFSQNRSNLDLV